MQLYIVQGLDADPTVARSPAWRLLKVDRRTGEVSECYDVHCTLKGEWECECGDWLFRRDKQSVDRDCKHIAALKASKIIYEPSIIGELPT